MELAPIVTVKQGQLQGKIGKDHHGKKYFSYHGIPYAKPPVGDLRFKAPLPAEPWYGVRDATKEGEICYSQHMIFRHMTGSEDCLFLNVYTPQLPNETTTLKPVMMWIHGGAFTAGSGNADFQGPEFLLPHDIVLVTINYRLGLLGFINFEDPAIGVPGNAGLKDQVMALKWIQENISSFNGDLNNVTIFGESAGGAAAHYLTLSPMAKGLFHKAIIQSGSATSVWAIGSRSAPLLAKALGLETATEHEIYDIVRKMSKEELFKLQLKVPDLPLASLKKFIAPVVEASSEEPAFLPKPPIETILCGDYLQIPTIFGYCSREGMIIQILSKLRGIEFKMVENFKLHVPHTLNIQDPELHDEIAKKIHTFYFAQEKLLPKHLDQYVMMDTDNLFLRSIIKALKLHLNTTTQPIYLYKLTLESSLNLFKKMADIKNPGAAHGDDLAYLFKTALTPEILPGSIEDEAIYRITKMWTNFAHNGNPNPKESDPLINTIWKPAEKDLLHFLDIGENLTVGVNPEFSRMEFWEEILQLTDITS